MQSAAEIALRYEEPADPVADAEYFRLQLPLDGNSTPAQETVPLDPILTVAADGLSIEVPSRDESTYARR